MLYTLKLYNVIIWVYLNKTEKNTKFWKETHLYFQFLQR